MGIKLFLSTLNGMKEEMCIKKRKEEGKKSQFDQILESKLLSVMKFGLLQKIKEREPSKGLLIYWR